MKTRLSPMGTATATSRRRLNSVMEDHRTPRISTAVATPKLDMIDLPISETSSLNTQLLHFFFFGCCIEDIWLSQYCLVWWLASTQCESVLKNLQICPSNYAFKKKEIYLLDFAHAGCDWQTWSTSVCLASANSPKRLDWLCVWQCLFSVFLVYTWKLERRSTPAFHGIPKTLLTELFKVYHFILLA